MGLGRIISCEYSSFILRNSDVFPYLSSLKIENNALQDNFNDLDEYLHYVYLLPRGNENSPSTSAYRNISEISLPSESASRKTCESNQLVVTFPDTTIQSAGYYRLLYFTRNSDSVLGMSAAFYVEENADFRESLDW